MRDAFCHLALLSPSRGRLTFPPLCFFPCVAFKRNDPPHTPLPRSASPRSLPPSSPTFPPPFSPPPHLFLLPAAFPPSLPRPCARHFFRLCPSSLVVFSRPPNSTPEGRAAATPGRRTKRSKGGTGVGRGGGKSQNAAKARFRPRSVGLRTRPRARREPPVDGPEAEKRIARQSAPAVAPPHCAGAGSLRSASPSPPLRLAPPCPRASRPLLLRGGPRERGCRGARGHRRQTLGRASDSRSPPPLAPRRLRPRVDPLSPRAYRSFAPRLRARSAPPARARARPDRPLGARASAGAGTVLRRGCAARGGPRVSGAVVYFSDAIRDRRRGRRARASLATSSRAPRAREPARAAPLEAA